MQGAHVRQLLYDEPARPEPESPGPRGCPVHGIFSNCHQRLDGVLVCDGLGASEVCGREVGWRERTN